MTTGNIIRRIVVKIEQHLRSLKSQKWLMEIIQSILIDFIKDYLKDCIKNVLEILFN